MQIDRQSMVELAEIVSKAVANVLRDNGIIGNIHIPVQQKPERKPLTAYQKTERLLLNYNGFQRIIKERQQDIIDLRTYGVPQKSVASMGERVQTSHSNVGIVLPEDAVEDAVRTVEASVQGTVQALALIDKGMSALKNDPYYKILEMRYFEGRTLEDIGIYFGCDHTTISRNKSRLIRELSMQLFPDEVIQEFMK